MGGEEQGARVPVRVAPSAHVPSARSHSVAETLAPHADWLVGGGEMATVIKAKDWSKTPLGPIESWPQSLRTVVSLMQASNSPISLAWGPGHVQIYNDGYWPICGDKHPTSMGQDFRECWAAPWPVIHEAYETAWAGKTSYLEKMRMFLERYGFLEETWFTFSFSPITDESGGVGGLFHPVTEMTDQMLSERRTRTLRDLAARAGKARTTTEAIALTTQVLAESELDLPFVLLYAVDHEAEQARLVGETGLARGTLVSPEAIDLHSPGDDPWLVAEVARVGVAQQIDSTRALLEGMTVGPYPEVPKMALSLPITQPGSEKPAAVMVAGVSSRLLVTESYRGFYDLMAAAVSTALANARAYEEERRKAEALAEIDRAKTAFFSNVSHEFRTPLTLMLGPLEDELAERVDALPPARRERIEVAHRNSLRLLKLVNTLLDFSRIEAGRSQASYEPIDLAAYTAELASVFRSAVEKAGLTLTIDCPPLPEPVFVDREMWEKIVLNLLSNALKHTFDGSIRVTMEWRGDHAQLTVADSGVGISAEDLSRIFERFHRVKGVKSRTHEGTGIGLALVRELAAEHGGTVRVESHEGKGTSFMVTIKAGRDHLAPERVCAERSLTSSARRAEAYVGEALHWLPDAERDPKRAPISEARSSACSPSASAVPAGPRRRILLADDNADMRDYVRRLLAAEYEVHSVADGLLALGAAQKEPPDLVLTDVMMPGLDGFGLLRELRSDPRTRTIPVILLSARAGEESAVEGLDAGADDYLAKPFSARELLARVRTHLELARRRREWANDLEQANKELESFSYSVSHDLRAPLRAIDGFSRAILTECGATLDATTRSHLERVRTATKRMSALIDDLLNLARISRHPIERETVSLTATARGITEELHRREPSRCIKIDIEGDLTALADPGLTSIVLENLLGNAWKFTSKKDAAHIQVGRILADGQDAFFVRDDGAGFDMAYAKKLFGAFQRLHGQSEFDGTGIGLATVQRIVSRHRGLIWAESEVGKGATFFFTLGANQ